MHKEGTTWLVDISDNPKRGDHVVKTPKNGVPVSELLERRADAVCFAKGLFFDAMGEEVPAVSIELAPGGVSAMQEYVSGRPLAHLSDEEIRALPEAAKDVILSLLLCNEAMRNRIGDFIDFFGYDDTLSWFMRIFRTLDVRFSTNIFITDDGKVKMPDFDLYHRRRSPLKSILAKALTPLMFLYIRRFKRRLYEASAEIVSVE